MKINYVSFLDPFYHKGGGEMVLSQLLKIGKQRGHELRLNTCSPNNNDSFIDQDLTLIADIFNCPGEKTKFSHNKIETIINSGPYVHFDNAYVDVCDLDYLPCNGDNQNICPHKGLNSLKFHLRNKTLSKECFANKSIVKKLYNDSLMNVFVSPLHKEVISKILKLDKSKGFVLRPIIDTNKFKNLKKKRVIENLFIGVISEAKGYKNLLDEYSDKQLTLIGKSIVKEKIKFSNWLGEKSYDDIPNYLNKTKNFVFKPRWPEPQGRVVVEAALCGCNLELNDNVGAKTFEFDISVPENYENAADEIWNKLEQLIE